MVKFETLERVATPCFGRLQGAPPMGALSSDYSSGTDGFPLMNLVQSAWTTQVHSCEETILAVILCYNAFFCIEE